MPADLDEITQRLVATYQPEAIYLFGSQARGDAGPDSDFDVLVVMPDGASVERCDSTRAYEALHGTGAAVDVIVMSRDRFQRRQHIPGSLPATVLREGRVLYAA
jgi:predicted nucleotidyltransferase